MKWLWVCTVALLVLSTSYGQKVLFDDVSLRTHTPRDWGNVMDSLSAHDIEIYMVSDKGWDFLDSVDVLWIEAPDVYYTDDVQRKIINFCRNNGKIFIGAASLAPTFDPINRLLADPGWHTGVRITNLFEWSDYVGMVNLPPFTNNVIARNMHLIDRTALEIEDTTVAFPFLFIGCAREHQEPVAAISYPFLYEGICNYIIIFSATHSYEVSVDTQGYHENYKFLMNIFFTMCNFPGYQFRPPCSRRPVDTTTSNCICEPNPFTPNGDGINDYCRIWFKGIEDELSVVYIYDSHSVEVKYLVIPGGAANSYGFPLWDGTTWMNKPVPQGVYSYVVEQNGKIICTGTITVAR